MFSRAEFLSLQTASGRDFSFDAACNDEGSNAHCATFACPKRSFFKSDVGGHHVWLNPPHGQLQYWVKHYQRCKAARPFDTSAVIIAPKGSLSGKLTTGMTLLQEYATGTLLFATSADSNQLDPAPQDLQAWYDPPQQPKLRVASPDNALIFKCRIGHTQHKVLIDTGASHSIVSKNALPPDLTVAPHGAKEVEVADGKRVTLEGTAQLPLHIQKYTAAVPALVMPSLLPGVDLILGMDWMRANGVKLDIPNLTCLLTKPANGSTKHILLVADSCNKGSTAGGEDTNAGVAHMKAICAMLAATTPDLMSASAARRAMRKNVPGMLVVVREAKPDVLSRLDTESSAPPACAAQLRTNPPIFPETPHLCATHTTPTNPTSPSPTPTIPETQLNALLDEFKDVFEPIQGPPKDRGIEHTIDLEPGAKPVFSRMYRLAPNEREEVSKQVQELLRLGLIQPSSSPWGAPILFAAKKDGGLRMCIDYRALNKVTVKNRYPIPNPEDLFDALHGATIFSSIDLQSGYHQIRINDKDRQKTAFRTPDGLYEFLVLSMGLANAPSVFQAVMNQVFQPYLNKFVLIYLDDVIIFSKTPEEHIEHLRTVLTALRQEQLQAKRSKCEFNRTELKFLGMIVSKDGLKVDESKVATVRDWPTPKEVSSLRGFLGLANYFRKFIQGYSSLVAPLTQLTGSTAEWQWGTQQEEAFNGVKFALTNAPVLRFPDPNKHYEVISDASLAGTGAVLMQEGHPAAYTSSKFTPPERNYTTTEQELLGVIKALKQWRCYLEGPQITLVTDHNPNTFIDSQKSLAKLSRRQVRWIEYLSRFHYTWEYRPGRINVADPLSRMHATVLAAKAQSRYSLTSSLPGEIRVSYSHDPLFVDARALARHGVTYDQTDGFYRCQGKIVVPNYNDLRTRIIRELHDSPYAGHRGIERTLELVQREFWWPGITSDVRRQVLGCELCQRNKPLMQKPAGLCKPLELPRHVWTHVSMDFITHLPTTRDGHDTIVVFVDRLTKMCRVAPTTETITAEDFAQLFLETVWRSHGFPEEVVSDRGSVFVNKFMAELYRLTGTKQNVSTAYHPQTDGQTERMNRVLQEILRNYVNPTHDDWDKKLPLVEFAINNTYQESIKATPFQLNYCRNPRLPTLGSADSKVPAAARFCSDIEESIQRAKRCISAAQERYKHYADRNMREVSYKVGDRVLLNTQHINLKHPGTKKFLPLWIGPYTVTQTIGPVAVKLDLPANYRIHPVFHVSRLKPHKQAPGSVWTPPPPVAVLDDGAYWSVDRLLAHRDKKRGGKTVKEYLVSWEGYGPEHNTWEPEAHITESAIDEYWASQATRRSKRKVAADTAPAPAAGVTPTAPPRKRGRTA